MDCTKLFLKSSKMLSNKTKLKKDARYCSIRHDDTIPSHFPDSSSSTASPRSRRKTTTATTATATLATRWSAMFTCRPLVSPPLPQRLAVASPLAPARPPPSSASSLRVVRCMAKERRVRMVAKQIQRELADMLTRDPVLQRAVLPEAALGADQYLSSLTTIADVELSNDLQVTASCVNSPTTLPLA